MTTSTRPRTRAAQEALRDAARREARVRRAVTWGGSLLVVGLLVAIVVAALTAGGRDGTRAAAGPVVVPANATAEGVVPVGQDDAPVTISVFFDYMCPFCGRFEAANGADLERLVGAGQVRLELRPLSFLDAQSDGAAFSTRTANALATVADGAPDRVLAFHQALFAEQPREGTSGPTDAELADVARTAEVPDAVVERFSDREFTGWVADVTERAFAAGVTGTPTVLVDGAVFRGDLYTAGPLAAAVEQAVQVAAAP